MRHKKHNHELGVKKEHRSALMANLAMALFKHGQIRTTLAKAKALRPFAEKMITLAKKAAVSENAAQKVHYRRQAIAQIRCKDTVAKLFNERVNEFLKRPGGYTRIYKLVPRVTDAAETAIIQLISAADEGYRKKPAKKAASQKTATTQAQAANPASKDENVAASAEITVSAE